MQEKKSFLLLEILVINLKGIKRSGNTEEIVQGVLIKEFAVAALLTSRLASMRSIISESSNKGQIEIPDCEEVLRSKICRKFFRKVTVRANSVKKSTTASIIDFWSEFNLKSLSFPA